MLCGKVARLCVHEMFHVAVARVEALIEVQRVNQRLRDFDLKPDQLFQQGVDVLPVELGLKHAVIDEVGLAAALLHVAYRTRRMNAFGYRQEKLLQLAIKPSQYRGRGALIRGASEVSAHRAAPSDAV